MSVVSLQKSARMTAVLLLIAGCAAPQSRSPYLARLDLKLSWSDRFSQLDFECETKHGQHASIGNDPFSIRIDCIPDPSVDSWVFITRTLSRKDRIGDTVATWAVILRVPAGLSGRSLDGKDVDVEIGAEWSIPPTQRRTTRVRCEAPYSGEIMKFQVPRNEDILAEGTLYVRQLP